MRSIAPIARLPNATPKSRPRLRKTTGLDLGDQPMKWWTWWWQDYNEMYNVSNSTDPGDKAGPSPNTATKTGSNTPAVHPGVLGR